MLVSITGSKRCIEIGVFHGYSALAIAEALYVDNNTNNQTTSHPTGNPTVQKGNDERWFVACDIDSKSMDVAKSHFKRAGLEDKVG